jgi:hypothetical protein
MNTYESPTIEQVGGPNNQAQPDVIVAIPDVLVFVEAVLAVFIVAAAITTVYTTANSIQNS